MGPNVRANAPEADRRLAGPAVEGRVLSERLGLTTRASLFGATRTDPET